MSRLLLLCLLCSIAWGQPDRWKELRFLVGEWTGEGGGTYTGAGAGSYTFLPELDGKILVRRNSSDYPAANGRPAIHHEDVMTVYREGETQAPQAIYFDNEGHVIRYAIEADPAGKQARFVSAPQAGQPRYRLTYRETGKDRVAGLFEVAPPGKPDSFTTYIEWTARRKK
jgi:hypothetical protein